MKDILGERVEKVREGLCCAAFNIAFQGVRAGKGQSGGELE